ncbi:hypothetical protein M9H77_22103 [Catharanthus roseus]|uniref:Uncharacterized protein n=1 Tax=Catharanthus roseus TaxID=4058 RepID=A0ACC0AR91_CATRO|nr:hypothetical protein M9H77_22103 [Catharanthus roseus]
MCMCIYYIHLQESPPISQLSCKSSLLALTSVGLKSRRMFTTCGGRKAEEEAAEHGAPMPDNLQLMAIISGGLSRDLLYVAGSEAAHLRAESSRAAAGLPPCFLEAEQRIIIWVETVGNRRQKQKKIKLRKSTNRICIY